MLSKNKASEIAALHQKKYRQDQGLFIVEGEKIVDELLQSDWELEGLYASAALYESYLLKSSKTELAEPHLFEKISALKTPSGILAVVKQQHEEFSKATLPGQLTLCLDGVRDPGNLGTIIRIADWFGIHTILCSEDCVDMYNPKVLQSSMGSFLRVKLIYNDLVSVMQEARAQHIPIYGAVLNGQDIYKTNKIKEGILVMGSESHGISATVSACIDYPVTIPSKLLDFSNSKGEVATDSLNVAIATAVICSVIAGYHIDR